MKKSLFSRIHDKIENLGYLKSGFSLSINKQLARPYMYSNGHISFEISFNKKECYMYSDARLYLPICSFDF